MEGIAGLLTSERIRPEHPALLFGDRCLTYAQLVQRVCRLAGGLAGLGIRSGDRVGILLHNSVEFLETFFAVTSLGAIAVPLNFRLAGAELRYILNDSGATTVISGGEFVGVLRDVQGETPALRTSVLVDGDGPASLRGQVAYEDVIAGAKDSMPRRPIKPTDDVLIMYTSGTTGNPKGATYTHGRMLWNAQAFVGYFGYHVGDISAVFGPLFHGGPFLCVVIPTIAVGGTVVLMASKGFRADEMLRVVEANRVTATLVYPTTLYDIQSLPNVSAFNYRSLRLVLTGGAPVPVPFMERFFELFPGVSLVQLYGLTEGPLCTTFLPPEDSVRKVGSIGKVAAGVEVKLVRDDGTLARPGEIGEIVGRSPGVVRGYWQKPEATRETFRDGWCRTGDLGRVDEEGYYYIVGRKKDMIISGAENIYPAEIEQVLLTHPSIAEVAVIGVPDDRWGEVVKAFVVLKPGATASADEIIAYCKERLASYKKPRHVEYIDALPRNASGKVLKHLLPRTTATATGVTS